MPGVSAEALLISALVSNGSVGEEVRYGISAADFEGYRSEYGWLVNYVETYASQPTRDIMLFRFPDFPFSEHTDVRAAADAVHRGSNRRRITTATTEAFDLLHLGDDEAAYARLMEAKPRRAVLPPRPLLTDTAHLREVTPYAIELPYRSLQIYTGGIQQGNLWYVAARPGQGKSAHLASIAKKAMLDGNRVIFYSLEMSAAEVRSRFHAALATDLGFPRITLDNLRRRAVETEHYQAFIDRLNEKLEACGGSLDVHTPTDGPVSPSVVAAQAGDYDLVVIDYVGLMSADGGGAAIDDWRMMAKISNSLKTTALAQKVAMICAAQINRDGETGSAPPKVKNLAQSDSLGQDGDVVLTMRAKPKNVATTFSIEKNRHGSSGICFHTTFDPNRGVYTEISADHAEDLVTNAEELAQNPNPPKLRVIKSKDEL